MMNHTQTTMSSPDLQRIVAPLLAWYDIHARVLPWRQNTDPYRIWISEIMLQQTRVEAVKPYYERFLKAFPDVRALAGAQEERILKLWEGLGYYNRARNLQKAARLICEKHGGVFPDQYDEILALPGIGSYTAGAIASISFGLPEPAVDGNVLRVLARLREDPDDIAETQKKKQVTEELRKVYPKGRSGDFTQSLMELGAVICLPGGAPLCRQCPLQNLCASREHQTQMDFPVKAKKKSRRKEKKTVLLLCRGQQIAIEKRPASGLLANLWQFPMADGSLTEAEVFAWAKKRGCQLKTIQSAGSRKHIFTHIEWEMQGYLGQVEEASSDFLWVTESELQNVYSLPSAFQPFAEFWYGRQPSR